MPIPDDVFDAVPEPRELVGVDLLQHLEPLNVDGDGGHDHQLGQHRPEEDVVHLVVVELVLLLTRPHVVAAHPRHQVLAPAVGVEQESKPGQNRFVVRKPQSLINYYAG